MIKRKIINLIISSGEIEEKDSQLYMYAIRSGFFLLIPFCVAVFIGILINQVINSIVFIIPFIVLRNFCGGFHLKKIHSCLIVSTVLVGALLIIGTMEIKEEMCFVITVISMSSIVLLSPIISNDKMIANYRIIKYKTIAHIISIGILIIVYLLCINGLGNLAWNITLGMFLTAMLQWPCIKKKYKKRKRV